MSWADRLRALGRLLFWRLRINRMQFVVGYFGLCFVGGFLGVLIFSLIAQIGGERSALAMLDHPERTLPFFVPIFYVALSVLIARAHDLGWPAAVPIFLYGMPGVYALLVPSGVVQVDLDLSSDAQHFLWMVLFGFVLLFHVMLFILAIAPGKAGANRYGPSPAPGL